jgi:hypothetical protein
MTFFLYPVNRERHHAFQDVMESAKKVANIHTAGLKDYTPLIESFRLNVEEAFEAPRDEKSVIVKIFSYDNVGKMINALKANGDPVAKISRAIQSRAWYNQNTKSLDFDWDLHPWLEPNPSGGALEESPSMGRDVVAGLIWKVLQGEKLQFNREHEEIRVFVYSSIAALLAGHFMVTDSSTKHLFSDKVRTGLEALPGHGEVFGSGTSEWHQAFDEIFGEQGTLQDSDLYKKNYVQMAWFVIGQMSDLKVEDDYRMFTKSQMELKKISGSGKLEIPQQTIFDCVRGGVLSNFHTGKVTDLSREFFLQDMDFVAVFF